MGWWDITRSKTGIPCIWETGGGMSNTGKVTLVCDKDGLPKTPLFTKQVMGEHALIPVVSGDIIVYVYRHHDNFTIRLWEIVEFVKSEQYPLAQRLVG